ncbi:hypothetical protein PsAD2_01048 [Pseudovibrio axinellae]|uniref:Uncharacterized protein n=1 Tax=Pseudovibrio axinellae TaxID=989403 RepID=A0A166AGY9_9HYPH|nr:hypothetical protein [Pseudovibrio axinellae]KZL21056.1 hypothetical protein PsAD2_01048 [Pseudovibrio axinellae]SEP77180.1 hypothetical protein SAMN05421798_101353 [Pseudovibrio axinellae]
MTRSEYIRVSVLLPPALKELVRTKAREIATAAGRRINITVTETSNSQRKLGSINAYDIRKHGDLIPELNGSLQLCRSLEDTTGHYVSDCDWENERMTMMRQTKSGDTHGWHWGDY